MVKKILIVLSLLLTLCILSSCTGVNEDELMEKLPSLIEEGRVLLDIIYGEGLPVDENGPESIKAGYVAVSRSAPYTSIDDLTSALENVFSESYASVLYITALNGVSYDPESISPRYIESDDGVMYADINYSMQIAQREPKYDSIRIIDSNRYMAKFEITMVYSDGREELDTVLVVNEDGKWKLDSGVL